jgi:hypothetical protein
MHCKPANIATEWIETACGYERRLHQVNRQIQTVYSKNESGSCSRLELSPFSTFFEMGDLLELDQLPALVSGHGGLDRLRTTYHASASDTERPVHTDARFFDSQLGSNCTPTRLADDTLRCVPTDQTIELTDRGPYADSDCEDRLAISKALPEACTPTPRPLLGEIRAANGRPVSHHTLTKLDPTNVYYRHDQNCLEQAADPNTHYYTPGPKTDLPLLHELIE